MSAGYGLFDLKAKRYLKKTDTQIGRFATMSADGSLIAWDGFGSVDTRMGTVLVAADWTGGFWGKSNLLLVHRAVVYLDDSNVGPVDVVDGRTGALVHRFEADGDVMAMSADGATILTLDSVSVARVRDAKTFEAKLELQASELRLKLSADGRFVYAVGPAETSIYRVADGAVLHQLRTSHREEDKQPETDPLYYLDSGAWDGASEHLSLLKVRVGDILTGEIKDASSYLKHQPNLAADFFAGKSL
ncbi:MAG: hypothetical protein U0271_34130 [Polyangiaceae bacterium]